MLRPLEGEPRATVPSEASLLVLPQVAPRIRAQLRRGEWVLLVGALVVWLPEALPLVELPYQVQLVLQLQAQPHPESSRRGRQAGLLMAQPRQESPPPVQQPQGLLASPPQVGQQQAKHQAAGSSPQRS